MNAANHRKPIVRIVVLLLAALALGSASCAKKRTIQEERAISVSDTHIMGQWKDYITIEDGEYLLEDSGGANSGRALITVRLSLKKSYTGRLEKPEETLVLVPLSRGGSEIAKTFSVASKEKFLELLSSEAGTSAAVTFACPLTKEDRYFTQIAGFDAKTIEPAVERSADNAASTPQADGPATRDTSTDPLFNPRTSARRGPRIVAVPELTDTKNVPEDLIIGVTGAITSGLLKNKKVGSVVDYNQINRIMQQHRFEASDWSNPAKYAEIGRALNVDTIAIGTISSSGSVLLIKTYTASVQLIDISTMSIAGASNCGPYAEIALSEALEQEIRKMDIKE
jgi:hypothetical protein